MKILLMCVFCTLVQGRIMNLNFKNDDRSYIQLSSFGYLKEGYLTMKMKNFKTKDVDILQNIGFTLDKASSEGRSSFVEHQENVEGCVLRFDEDHHKAIRDDTMRAIMRIENKNKTLGTYQLAVYTMGLSNLTFFNTSSIKEVERQLQNQNKNGEAPTSPTEQAVEKAEPSKSDENVNLEDSKVENSEEEIEDVTNASEAGEQPQPTGDEKDGKPEAISNKSSQRKKRATPIEGPHPDLLMHIPVSVIHNKQKGEIEFSMEFSTLIQTDEQEGLYELYFHNCRLQEGSTKKAIQVSGEINITESNKGNLLSAGDMCLPMLYMIISSLFFFMAFQWVSVLCVSKGKVFVIHYMMAVLVVIKGLSLAFHSVDLYFISKDGTPETWAIIFYVVHLLKGVLLFIILLLIGTGWAFIKYVLSDREKKLFMIIIPLQVFANIAYIVIQDTSESSKSYYTWKNVMIMVDILCCVAILAPVVWSVRHLQEASRTDGKAAINLVKLKLFQRFYMMIICYLYFTRLIVYLLEITLPFRLIWINVLFSELGSLVFFFLTGYQFRPGCDNPYLSVPQEDYHDVESMPLTESGVTQTVSKRNELLNEEDFDNEDDLLLPEWRKNNYSSEKV